MRPEGISTLTPKSVKKKLKQASFAAGVERDEVAAGVELVGAELTEHIQLIIDALKPHAEELGIVGKVTPPSSGLAPSPVAQSAIASTAFARTKSFIVSPPASCVLSVTVTLR